MRQHYAYARLLASNEDVLDAISAAETIYMSIFVLGELYAEFARGKSAIENCIVLQIFSVPAGFIRIS